jgi:hypothetical protein
MGVHGVSTVYTPFVVFCDRLRSSQPMHIPPPAHTHRPRGIKASAAVSWPFYFVPLPLAPFSSAPCNAATGFDHRIGHFRPLRIIGTTPNSSALNGLGASTWDRSRWGGRRHDQGPATNCDKLSDPGRKEGCLRMARVSDRSGGIACIRVARHVNRRSLWDMSVTLTLFVMSCHHGNFKPERKRKRQHQPSPNSEYVKIRG